MSTIAIDIINRYGELFELYKDTDKRDVLAEAEALITEGKLEAAKDKLSVLETKQEMMARITSFIKCKPLFRELRRIRDGKVANKFEELKAFSSLFTHITIECEKGRTQYRALLRDVYTIMGELLYE